MALIVARALGYNLPELYNQTESCVLSKPEYRCDNPWYSTSVGGDRTSCSYSGDLYTDGLYTISGSRAILINDTTDGFDVGVRTGANFALNYLVAHRCTYSVCLVFRELVWTTNGSRVFDVYANGQVLVQNLDIVSAVGRRVTPYVQCYAVNVTTRLLSIQLIAKRDAAALAEVKICQLDCAKFRAATPLPKPSNSNRTCRILPTPPPMYQYPIALMNVGGPAICNFSADGQPVRGLPVSVWVRRRGTSSTGSVATNSSQQDVLGTYRFGYRFSYTMPSYGGFEYHIRITFMEPYFQYAAQRAFSVLLDGQPIANALDIVTLATPPGPFQPYAFTYNWVTPGTPRNVGNFTIAFDSLLDKAIVSAIEVYKVGPVRPPTRRSLLLGPQPVQPLLPEQSRAASDTGNPQQQHALGQAGRKLLQRPALWSPHPNPCGADPYDCYSIQDCNERYQLFANQSCPDLVPYSEVRRGMGAFRTECQNQPQPQRTGDWNPANSLMRPCCRQCVWAPEGLARILTPADLPDCPRCVRDRYRAKYPSLATDLLTRASFSSPRCPRTPAPYTNWVLNPANSKCYQLSNAQFMLDVSNYGNAESFCRERLSGTLIDIKSRDEELWVLDHLLFKNGFGAAQALVGARRRGVKEGPTNLPWYWEGVKPVEPLGTYVNGGRGPRAFTLSAPNPTQRAQCLLYTMQDPENSGQKRWASASCQPQSFYFICEAPAV